MMFFLVILLFCNCSGYLNDRLYLWGDNLYFQSCQNDTTQDLEFQLSPHQILYDEEDEVIASSCQTKMNVFLMTTRGNVYATGRSLYSGLGLEDDTKIYLPTKVNITNVTSIKCFYSSVSVLKEEQYLYAWGTDTFGKFGLGNSFVNHLSPVYLNTGLLGNNTVVDFGLSEENMIVYIQNDTGSTEFISCGNSEVGILGSLTANVSTNHWIRMDDSEILSEISSSSGGRLMQIEMHNYAAFILIGDGSTFSTLYFVGRSDHSGCEAQINATNAYAPIRLEYDRQNVNESNALCSYAGKMSEMYGKVITYLTCGYSACMALTTEGIVYSWGRPINGQLGRGVDQYTYSYVALPITFDGGLYSYWDNNTKNEITKIVWGGLYVGYMLVRNTEEDDTWLIGWGYDNHHGLFGGSENEPVWLMLNMYEMDASSIIGEGKIADTYALRVKKFTCFQENSYDHECGESHGFCLEQDTCICDTNWFGDICTVTTCFNITSNATENVCHHHGSCVSYDKCSCETNVWGGTECAVPMCFGVLSTETDTVCSGNGECVSPDTCECNFGWEHDECESRVLSRIWPLFLVMGGVVLLLLILVPSCMILILLLAILISSILYVVRKRHIAAKKFNLMEKVDVIDLGLDYEKDIQELGLKKQSLLEQKVIELEKQLAEKNEEIKVKQQVEKKYKNLKKKFYHKSLVMNSRESFLKDEETLDSPFSSGAEEFEGEEEENENIDDDDDEEEEESEEEKEKDKEHHKEMRKRLDSGIRKVSVLEERIQNLEKENKKLKGKLRESMRYISQEGNDNFEGRFQELQKKLQMMDDLELEEF